MQARRHMLAQADVLKVVTNSCEDAVALRVNGVRCADPCVEERWQQRKTEAD